MNWKVLACLNLLLALIGLVQARGAEEKAILDVAPTLAELGEGWTTNVVAYLLDPRSRPTEIDYHRDDPKSSPVLEIHRKQMAADGRTGYGMMLCGCSNTVANAGFCRVYIQRWGNTRTLHNRWVDWKMLPTRVLHAHPPVGEDSFWREDCMFQEFTFRRGLFHVCIEAGHGFDYRLLVHVAEIIDAKIRDKPSERTL
jgi:hypothetical protein